MASKNWLPPQSHWLRGVGERIPLDAAVITVT